MTDDDQTTETKTTDWRDVQRRLERFRRQGEKYMKQGNLAKRLNCSRSTINKAIAASPKLTKWMTEARRSAPRARTLNGVVADSAQQTVEEDPSDLTTDDEIDAVMAKLVDQAKPEERANLNALDAEGRRRLVQAYRDQRVDQEPSPLDDDKPNGRPQKVKHFKRV